MSVTSAGHVRVYTSTLQHLRYFLSKNHRGTVIAARLREILEPLITCPYTAAPTPPPPPYVNLQVKVSRMFDM
jgi:hypothetical protein